MAMNDEGRRSSGPVPVRAISQQRLALWLADCERDHATPFVLVAIGHDEQAGVLHLYRLDGGPTNAEVALLLRAVATQMERAAPDG